MDIFYILAIFHPTYDAIACQGQVKGVLIVLSARDLLPLLNEWGF